MEITITFSDGRTKMVAFDGMLKMRHIRMIGEAGSDIIKQLPIIADLLGLTTEETEELTLDQYLDIVALIQTRIAEKVAQSAVPNAMSPR